MENHESDIYYTIESASRGLYKEKMSKFISFAIPVGTVAEAKSRIAEIANEYHDARHVCWAYMVGPARKEYLSSDNGEPSGTAGKPILGQINSHNLTNIAIAVVRYFGGIKLGTSGLISAYREAAREAIESARIIECHERERVTVTYSYMVMNDVMKIAKSDKVTVVSQQFDNTCEMTLEFNLGDAQRIKGQLANIEGVSLTSGDTPS